jgi:hypothetical protein
MTAPAPRHVYGLLGARSLSYARICLGSLFRNVIEPISLTLITDKPSDKVALSEAVEQIAPDPRHSWRVCDESEADERAEVVYAKYPLIRWFRKGNPCWRKVTDPSLFAEDGQEMVVLDPDVYFPNPFNFESTPATGLLLMWQAPNCLYPPETVRHAFDQGIRMVDHSDIGVSQATFPFDYDWLEHLIGKLGGRELPTWSMHVEPIVWAAMGMKFGGGYLDPKAWFCWRNALLKRLRVRVLKTDGVELLRSDPFGELKCFHAGGSAKHWLVAAENAGLFSRGKTLDKPLAPIPYVEYRRQKFERKQMAVGIARSLGLMKLLASHS